MPKKNAKHRPKPKRRSVSRRSTPVRRSIRSQPAEPPEPKVAVVVLNHNGVDFLWNCLFSLKTQAYRNYEVILVDNASKDGSVAFVKTNYPGVKILECQENFGYALGNNLGAQSARDADLIVFLNNDTVVPPEWLRNLVSAFRQYPGSAGAVMSLVKDRGVPADHYSSNGTLNFLGHRISRAFPDLTTVFYPTGCAFLYDPKLIPGAPFDPDYFLYQEDVYFGWRCRLRGLSIHQAPDSKVFHAGSGTVRKTPPMRITYFQERNRYMNLFLFYGTWTLIRLMPWILLDMIARVLYALITARKSILGTVGACSWLLFHIPSILQKRARLQKTRRVPDSRILGLMSGKLLDGDSRLVEFLNDVSLLYCQIMGLRVLELEREKGRRP